MQKDPLDLLTDYIDKNFKKTLKEIAVSINIEMEMAYEMAIQAFYDDYTPSYYQRTGSSMLGASYSEYISTPSYYDNKTRYNPIPLGEYGYNAGIVVDSNFIPGDPYDADKDWVFNRTYEEGIHGMTHSEQKKWGQSDYWVLKSKKIAVKRYLNKYNKDSAAFHEIWKHISKLQHSQYKKYRKGITYLRKRSDFVFLLLEGPQNSNLKMKGKTPESMVSDFFYKYRKSDAIQKRIEKELLGKFLNSI